MRHVLAEPVADQLLLVPEVRDTRIGHTVAVPPVAAIAVQHVEPDSVHAQVRTGVVAKNVALDPTGRLATLGSSGRHQQEEPGLTSILVEARLQIGDIVQVGQAHRAGSRLIDLRCAANYLAATGHHD